MFLVCQAQALGNCLRHEFGKEWRLQSADFFYRMEMQVLIAVEELQEELVIVMKKQNILQQEEIRMELLALMELHLFQILTKRLQLVEEAGLVEMQVYQEYIFI